MHFEKIHTLTRCECHILFPSFVEWAAQKQFQHTFMRVSVWCQFHFWHPRTWKINSHAYLTHTYLNPHFNEIQYKIDVLASKWDWTIGKANERKQNKPFSTLNTHTFNCSVCSCYLSLFLYPFDVPLSLEMAFYACTQFVETTQSFISIRFYLRMYIFLKHRLVFILSMSSLEVFIHSFVHYLHSHSRVSVADFGCWCCSYLLHLRQDKNRKRIKSPKMACTR